MNRTTVVKAQFPYSLKLCGFVPGYYIHYNQCVKSSYCSNVMHLTFTAPVFLVSLSTRLPPSFLSSLRCVAILSTHLFLPSLPD